MPPPDKARLLVAERDGLRLAVVVAGGQPIDLAVDVPGETRRYQSIWQAKIDRIVPHVGAFVALGSGAGLLREGTRASGDRVMVQVKSLRAEGKADIVTEDIALPGRAFVYLPHAGKIAVSSRLAKTSDHTSLVAALNEAGIAGGILRTHAQDTHADGIVEEAVALHRRWQGIVERATGEEGLVEEGPDAPRRLEVDYPAHETAPATDGLEGIDLDSLLRPEIRMARGGTVMIEETAALTAIDVNAGTRKPDDADRDAATLIARHIRLRNLSGLILIDFAAASSKKAAGQENAILQTLRRAMADDPAGCRIAGVTPAGLIELTRTARDLPLADKLCRQAGRA